MEQKVSCALLQSTQAQPSFLVVLSAQDRLAHDGKWSRFWQTVFNVQIYP